MSSPSKTATRLTLSSERARAQLAGALLFLMALWAFLPAIHNGFLTYDDPEYITANPYVQNGLTWAGIKWAFSAHGANWHPVTWISHLLDGQFFGLRPWGHHLTNILLHAANTLLVFWVLRKLTGATGRSFFVALLFGLHPLRVESVAWVAERKDVLSVFFFLLALSSYARYAEATQAQSPRAKIHYGLALLWFVLGLLAKSMLVTFPCVLLLLDFWPLERFRQTQPAKLVAEKWPFFAASGAMCVIARLAQEHGTALVSSLSLHARLQNALVSYCRYLGKIFWPMNLSPLYPGVRSWPALWVCAAAMLLAAVSIAAILWRKKFPWWFVGWFWFLGTLVPVIGIIQIGEQSLADRYTYIPSLGILIAVVWSAHELTKRSRSQAVAASLAGITAALVCFGITRAQIHYWKTTESMFARAVAVTQDNTLACVGLGSCLAERGELDAAISLYHRALQISPNYYEAHHNLGLALAAQGRLDDAVAQYQLAIQDRPDTADCHVSLGAALARQGHLDSALAQFERAIELDPANVIAHADLAALQAQNGHLDIAMAHLRSALQYAPDNADLHNDLGTALARVGQLGAAITEFQTAMKLNLAHPHAAQNLARAKKLQSSASR